MPFDFKPSSLAAKAALIGGGASLLLGGGLSTGLLQLKYTQTASTTSLIIAAVVTVAAAIIAAISQQRLMAPLGTLSRGLEGISASSDESANMRVAWEVLLGHGTPIRREGDALMAGPHRLNDSVEVVDAITRLVGGTATVFLGDRRIATNVMAPNGRRATGTTLAQGPVYDAVLRDERPFRGEADILGVPYVTAYDPIRGPDGTVIGILYVGVPKAEAEQAGRAADLQVATITLAPALLTRRDEVGVIARALTVLKAAALDKLRLEGEAKAERARAHAEQRRMEADRAVATAAQTLVVSSLADGLAKLSRGDLTHRLAVAFAPDYERLRSDFNAAMDNLNALIAGIVVDTNGLRSGTGEISQASDDLSRRTEQQAASLEQTAAALDEITATVHRTAEAAKRAKTLAAGTQADAEESGKVVRQAIAAMDGIEQSSQQIAEIVGLIDEIALQTNLLALNASVEAARAGDAGRGFGVVASEVRALAQRAAQASRQIRALIKASSGHVASGAALVASTGGALELIVKQIAELALSMSDIAVAAKEQSAGLAEVNTAINHMDQVTQQNAAMMEQSTAAVKTMAEEAEHLAQLTARLRVTPPSQEHPNAQTALLAGQSA